ncbi:MAG TPA: RNA methyltransferase, partial [Alphaproteobacteria bacterium]|nr:RNA methyltransferase [Alphaproteobacteria bacterium]
MARFGRGFLELQESFEKEGISPMETIFGKHSVRAVFMTRPEDVRRILLLSGKMEPPEEFIALARRHGLKPDILPWDRFLREAKLTEADMHQGVCIVAEDRPIYTEAELDRLRDARLVLALDQISNPQNLGTILRVAAFFGVDGVLLLKNRSVDITSTAVRVAVGGAEFVKLFRVTNLARSLEKLKSFGFWVYGLDERGEKTLAQTQFPEQTVFVMGAEGEGLRQRTGNFCDALVRIPGGRPGLERL